VQQTTPGYPNIPAGVDMQQNLDRIAGMDDSQIDNMVNMMRANPGMLRAQYETMHGKKMTDTEFNQMMANLSPETIKMGTNMAKNNPDMFKQQMAAAG